MDDLTDPDPYAPQPVDSGQARDGAAAADFGRPEPQGPADEPMGREVPEPPDSGDPAVDEVTAAAAAAAAESLEEQVAAYERAHRTLQDRLADVEG